MSEERVSDPFGPDRQVEVYSQGMLADEPPDHPVSFESLEARAQEALPSVVFDHVAGGAGAERTVRRNRTGFDRWHLIPRMLRDVSDRDLSVDLLGGELTVPVMLAPIGVQSILHEEAESAVARAAEDLDVPMVLSSVSSTTLEEVADELGSTPAWFQLYWSSDRSIVASFLDRAETAGYEAIVLTVDTPIPGWRERDMERGYLPYLEGEGLANYFADPAFREALDVDPEENPGLAIQHWIDVFGDPSITWADLSFIHDQTDLPVVIKGILHPDDARRAIEAGADGLIVSNHGGRQVDGAIGAIEALPDVVAAVDGAVPVLFDSGIRRGADAIKAIALGADAVLLGRPYAYGLGIDGEAGVRAVLKNFLADLDVTLGLCGQTSIRDLDRSVLADAG